MTLPFELTDPSSPCRFLRGRWEDVLDDLICDVLITDPPYSEKTHKGHNAQRVNGRARRKLDYKFFTEAQARLFVRAWAPRTRGWMVILSDDVLAPIYRDELGRVGRYAFAPLPFVVRNMTCRFRGDGPSSWTAHVTVGRPRTREFAAWGTLDGAYGPYKKERLVVPGGKVLAGMRDLIRDYSRPGDLVCDPCAGGATTLLAACLEGRYAVGAERRYHVYRKGVARLSRDLLVLPAFPRPERRHHG